MPGLTGKLTKPNKLSPAERGIRSGIANNIARNGAASVNKGISAAVNADAVERESLLTQFEVAGKSVPQELLEQLDMRSELRRERATFEAADGAVAAQYTKQFDPIVMAENSRILDANIGNLSRDVTSQGAKIERQGKLVDLAKGLADLQQTKVKTEGSLLDNQLKQFEADELEISQRMDTAFGGVATSEITKMIADGRMATLNVPLGRAYRYAAQRRKNDIDLQMDEMGLRKSTAQARDAEAKLRTSKTKASDAAKQQVLLGMNTEELSALSRQVRSSGSFVADGVTFNQVDVANALETVQTSGALGRELKMEQFQATIAEDELITDMNEVGFMMNAVFGGGGEAYATMTVDDLNEQRSQLEAVAAVQMPDDATGQQKLVNDQMKSYVTSMQSKATELRTAAIARTPEKARPALIDITQRGYITTSGVANNAMVENLAAFATMEKGSYYSGAGRVIFNGVTGSGSNNNGDEDRVAAILGTDKKKTKLDATQIASALTNADTERAIVENVSGRIAQGGAVAAFGVAGAVLSDEQRQAIGAALFDPAKAGMKQNFLLPDRPEQINWATAIPEIGDMIVAGNDFTAEEQLKHLGEFFGLMQQGYVDTNSVQQVTGQAAPRTMPEHQVWANARLISDAVVPFPDQVKEMLHNEAADLSVYANEYIADYASQIDKQEGNRRATRRDNARLNRNLDYNDSRLSAFGQGKGPQQEISDSEAAAIRAERLARERANITARELREE